MKLKNNFKKIILLVLMLSCLFGFFQAVKADQLTDINKQLGATAGTEGANLGKASDPRLLVAYVVQIFLGVIGIIFVAYTVYAGYILIISGGKEEDITKAKSTILYSVIGLAIVLSAYALTWFVGTYLTKATMISPTDDTYFGIGSEWQTEQNYVNPCANDPLGC